MRKIIAITAVAGTLTVTAAAFGATKSVKVGDNYYVKKGGVPTVTVKRGDTVVWRWRGKNPHNVDVTSGPVRFKSKVLRKGTFRRKMTRAGTYRIMCDIHGSKQRMTLRVR